MMGSMSTFQDLVVWQRGIDLVESVYLASSRWPDSEMYGLVSQARRAAVSIPANIAEGHGRGSVKEFFRFLSIARGSLRELETHLIIALRMHFLEQPDYDRTKSLSDEVGRLLQGLMRKLESPN